VGVKQLTNDVVGLLRLPGETNSSSEKEESEM